jgi:hypothetical protein
MNRTLAALAAIALLSVFPALAQGQGKKGEDFNTRTVEGVVTSAEDATVNGAVVQLKNTKTLQIRSFITKDAGNYYFNGLSPDVDYELKAEYSGAASPVKTLSSFDSHKKAVMNLKLNKK